MFATQRKSALIAPVAVVATLAYFRRRELLSLAPLGLVIWESSQRRPRRARSTAWSPSSRARMRRRWRPRAIAPPTTTPSAPTLDAPALRPGFGSYNHDTYRILDSEILGRLVETGVLGLVAFLLVGISVMLVSRRTIAARDPRWAPPLCAALRRRSRSSSWRPSSTRCRSPTAPMSFCTWRASPRSSRHRSTAATHRHVRRLRTYSENAASPRGAALIRSVNRRLRSADGSPRGPSALV